MSYKNVTCVCEKNEIKKNKEKRKNNPEKSSRIQFVIRPAQWVCHERRIILYVIPILYKWRGWIEAGHSNQTCVRGWVMTCNMSPCQPQLTEHTALARLQVVTRAPGISSPRTNTKSDGAGARVVSSEQKSAWYCQMMSSKINPVIQSFQSELRLFQSLKTHGDREPSRSW